MDLYGLTSVGGFRDLAIILIMDTFHIFWEML